MTGDNRGGSVRRNSLWLLLARLTAQVLAILFIALVARRLDIGVFGRFAVIAALVLIGNTFTNFGTDTFLIREIARSRQIAPLGARVLGLQLSLSVIWWLGVLVLRPDLPLLIYSLSLFPLAGFSVAAALLRSFERMDLFSALSLANGVIQVLAALISNELWTLCVSLMLGQILIALLAVWVCARSLPDFHLLPFGDVRSLVRVVWPFAALTILLVLSQRLGVLSLSALAGDVATGLFSAIVRVVDGLKLGHFAVLGALLPVLARGGSQSKQSFRQGFLILIALSFLFAISLIFLARPVVEILYGESFKIAAGLLPLLGWSLVPYTISSFISYDLIARGSELALLKATIASLLIFGVLYYGFISAYGLPGAVWAALIGECLQAIIFFLFALGAWQESKQTSALFEITNERF